MSLTFQPRPAMGAMRLHGCWYVVSRRQVIGYIDWSDNRKQYLFHPNTMAHLGAKELSELRKFLKSPEQPRGATQATSPVDL